MKRMILILFSVFLFLGTAFSQTKTLDRQYTPIVLSDLEAPIAGSERAVWSAWVYDQSTSSWKSVPFQIDDIKSNGGYEHTVASINPIIGAEDELVFMPGDLGDKAPASEWLVDADPETDTRLELEFTDPLDASKQGWVYLYKNVVEIALHNGYFDYTPPPNPSVSAADTVFSRYYKLAHQNNGFFNYLTFDNNSDLDLLDRLKMRFDATSTLIPTDIKINENSITPKTDTAEGSPVSAFPGEVRLFRDIRDKFKVDLSVLSLDLDLDPKLQYFPYSIQGEVDLNIGGAFLGQVRVNFIRLSLDMSPNASRMTYYSNKNRNGFAIDGEPDTPEAIVDEPFALNWMMATGEKGTVILMLQMPEVERGNTTLFYYDDKNGGSKDGSDDTGDQKSYGDMGMWSKTTSDGLKISQVFFRYSLYFINQDMRQHAAELGDLLTEQHLNPLTLSVAEQEYVSTNIADNTIQPLDFELNAAYPNPYQVGNGNVTFSFQNINLQKNVQLSIYNILGQKVMQFNNISLIPESSQALSWDGKGLNGQPVSQGIYFYRVTGTNQQLSGKLLIMN